MKKFYGLLIGIILLFGAKGQVTNYTFSQTSGTYNAISGTTAIASNWDDNIASVSIPFSFIFNKTAYTSCTINSNGFITFGATLSSSSEYFPISSTTSYSGAISALGLDLGNNGSPITYTTINSAPNRVFIIQWTNALRFSGATTCNGNFNFQIRLSETSNKIDIVYGNSSTNFSTDVPVQVGLRGTTGNDFNNRTTTTNWTGSTTGSTNTSTCLTGVNSGELPTNGLTYSWTPPVPAITVLSPTSACAGTAPNITLTGNGFTAASSFKFNGVSATSFAVVNDSTITGVLPASGVTSGSISVTTPNGIATSSVFTINNSPSGTLMATENSGVAANDNIICSGAPVTFTATSGFGSYVFKINGSVVQTGISNSFSTTSLANGASVTVDVANASNCGATFGPVIITVNPLPTAGLLASKTTICPGDNVIFTASGGTNYNFKINGLSIQSGTTGSYNTTTLNNGASVTVDVTNSNGCTATATPIVITVNNSPTGTLSSSTTTICSGNNITFTATNGFTSYEFKVNGTTLQGPISSNVYNSTSITNGSVVSVIATNSSGCSAAFNPVVITVNALPSGTLTATENSGTPNDNIICTGAPVTFMANPGFSNYDFKINGISKQNSSSNSYINSTLANGDQITVVVKNSSNCIATFNAITITVVGAPAGTLSASSSLACQGSNIDFTATAGFANYNFQVNGNAVQNGTSNIYSTSSLSNGDQVSVDVTNSNGCISTFGPATASINSLPTGILTAVENSGNSANDGIICTGTGVVFTATGGFNNYNFILNGSSVQNGPSSTYTTSNLSNNDNITVGVINGNGCISFFDTITVAVNALPSISSITGNTNICLSSTSSLSDATKGGAWSSLDPSIASVSAANGIVTAASSGTTTINYSVTNSNGCTATANTVITVNAPPAVAAITGNKNVCTGTSSQLSDATTGGIWSSNNTDVVTINSTTGMIAGVTAGSALVSYTVTNGNGCSTIISATIIVNDFPVVEAINPGTPVVCAGSVITLSDATSGGTWNSDNTSVATVNSSGVVTGVSAGTAVISYSITTSCGQPAESHVTITVNPSPSLIITNAAAVCSPNTADLTALGITSGSTSGLTFSYYTNAAATIVYNSPSTTGAGTYYIKGTTSSGCFDSKPVIVTVNPSPTLIINTPAAVCSPATVDITIPAITSGSTAGLSLSYFSDATGTTTYNTPTNSGAGTYYIKGTTTAGCSNIKPVTVVVNPAPSLIITNPTVVCSPATADLTATAVTAGSSSGLTFTYYTNAAATSVYNTPTTATAGTYYIKATNSSGCYIIKPVVVTVNISPVLVISNPSAICAPATVDLTTAAVTAGSTSGLIFTYYTDAAATITYNTPTTVTNGSYYIKGTNASGCFDIKPVTVTINSLPGASVTGTTSVCQNAPTHNVTFTGSSGIAPYKFTYTINSGSNLTIMSSGSVATVTVPTTITGTFVYTLVNVQDASSTGCIQNQNGSATVTVNSPTAVPSLSASPSTICLGTSGNLVVAPLAATTLISENFEGTNTFSIVNGSGNVPASSWTSQASTYNYGGSPFNSGSKFMLANSDQGAGVTNTALVSPAVNTTGYSALTLTYRTYYRPFSGDLAVVEGSTDNGTTWSVIQNLTGNTTGVVNNFSIQTLNLNSYLNSSSFMIRFRYTGNDEWYWAIDDVSLVASPPTYNYSWTSSPAASGGLPLGASTPAVGNSNIVITPSAAGTIQYTATLTNSAGCTSFSNVSVLVNPSPSVTITADYCAVPGKVHLNANATGGTVTYLWSTGETKQSIDVDIAGQYSVAVSLGTGCNVTASIGVAQELVTNGSFTNGNTGFISDYMYQPDVAGNSELISDAGTNGYAVGANGQNYHNNFWGVDHTGNTAVNRNYMIINGHGTLKVWQETVNVLPNTTYYFSGWGMSLNSLTPFAKLQFNVNGSQVGSVATLASGVSNASNNGWTRFYGTWNSGPTTTTAVIQITDLETSLGGNDFGLDDISFATLSTFVELESPSGTDAQTVCANNPITPIVYSVGSTASAPIVTGLPSGLITSFNGELFTISGSPSTVGNYAYTITTTGTCNPVSASGSINVQANTITLTSGSSSPNICINTPINIGYTLSGTATGASASGLPAGVMLTVSGTSVNITGTPTIAGSYPYTITISGICNPVTTSGTITVQSQTITLTSTTGTDVQTICINTPITNIQYAVSGQATSATVSGLPAGVTGNYSNGLFIISGTPSVAGSFNYIVTTTGSSCAGVSVPGSITANAGAMIVQTSSASTNPEAICKGVAISNVTFSITNATGAAITSGVLPTGVSSSYNSGIFTISGTPTVSGVFSYTITTSGGCGFASITGTINVQSQTVVLSSGSATPSICINTTVSNIVYTLGGTATSAIISGLPTGVTSSIAGNVVTISGTPMVSGTFSYTVTSSGTCGNSSAAGVITVKPAAVGGTINSVSICSGANGSLTLSGQSGSIVRWEASINGGSSWASISNNTISQTFSNVTLPTLYRAVMNNSCGNVYSSIATVGIHNYWTGAVSTDWNIPGNWSNNQVPSISCPNVYIPNTTNKPVLNNGTGTINNLIIMSGGNLTINGAGILQISGSITNSGTFDVSAGTIEFNGSTAQSISANTFYNHAVADLKISNSSASGVTLNDSLNIYRSLTYGPSGTTFITNGHLTLKSTLSQTAYIGDMTGHTITGDVTVERYIATGTASAANHGKSWQLLAVPTTGQTIKAAWQEGATATNVSSPAAGSAGNPVAGYGTMLTSNVANATMQSTPGFDALTSSGASIKVYNSATNGYDGATNTGAPVYNQKGYFIFIRGDRGVYTSTGTAVPTILRTKGQLFTPANLPPVTTVLAGKFESVGNPYAAPLDMRQITKGGGATEFFQVWDPRLGGGYNYGAYQTFSFDGTNYTVTPGGGSYGTGGSVNNYIQSGQAFFVQAYGSDGTVSFTEAAKAGNVSFTSTFTRQGSSSARTASPVTPGTLRTSLHAVNTDGSTGNIIDGVLSQFTDTYSNGIDGLDAVKSGNTGENLSIKTAGKLLSIERKHTITDNDTIFLNLTGERVQQYQFSFDAQNLNTHTEGFVVDAYTNTRTPLNLNGNTLVNFSVVNIAGSYAANRFMIVFSPLKVLPVTFTSIKAYKQDNDINVAWKVENEFNIKQYEVEKSADGKAFTTLTVSKPSDNKGGSASYTITDTKPVTGYNYYHIRSVDINGAINYSTIVKVAMEAIEEDINIYPNPITDGQIHLQFRNEAAGKYNIRLLNNLGQVIMEKKITREEDNNTELIRWDFNLAHGMYQLEVTRPDGGVKNLNVIY